MRTKLDLSAWPDIDTRQAGHVFHAISSQEYPELASYSRSQIHEGLAGQGGLFLASDMAKFLTLKPGMCVLDLGCGAGTTSIFLAKEFGVTVYAFDGTQPESLPSRARGEGVGALVNTIQGNARNLPFPKDFFDAVFSMNAFFYFGTDDFYPSYLLSFIKKGADLVIGGPCYRAELEEDTPEEFLLEFPACLAVHSPNWWRRHFTKTGQAEVLHSELHPHGAAFWDDRVNFLLEATPPGEMTPPVRDMVHAMIRMLNRDEDGFVSHFMLHAKKKG